MPSVARGLRLIEVNAPSRSSPTPSGRSGMTPGFGACGWLGHGPYRDCPGPDSPYPCRPGPLGVPYPPEAPYPPGASYPPGAPASPTGWPAPSPGGWPGSYGGGAYPPGSPAGGNQGRGWVPPSPSPALVPGGTLSVIFLLTGTARTSAGTAPRWRPYSHEAPGGETALRPSRIAVSRAWAGPGFAQSPPMAHTRAVDTRALRWLDPPDGPAVVLLDQTRLPAEEEYLTCRDVATLDGAIRRLVVRGAPLLGLAGAYGVALAAYRGDDVAAAADVLGRSRPTAVNLSWGAAAVSSSPAVRRAAW